jgi:hypothetical protein
MLTQYQVPATAPASASGTSRKLLRLLRRRLRQLLRVTLVLALGLALTVTALAIWWLTSLNGLPDIGDPFDVATFRAFRVSDDQNAFTFLRRADEKLAPMPAETPAASVSGVVSWAKAHGKGRVFLHRARGLGGDVERPALPAALDRGHPLDHEARGR